MTELIARRDDAPMPLAIPVLLSFVAGYLDSYTYLSLFGLFAAQVTGSFVIAGAEFVTSDFGIAGKLIAIAAFVLAAAATAATASPHATRGAAHCRGCSGLKRFCSRSLSASWCSARRCATRAIGTASSPACLPPRRWARQSVLVRLLMKDVPQTNVMTGNMTQLGIAATELIMTRLVLARRRIDRSRQGDAAVREFAIARDRLVTVLAMAVGFLAGAAAGALAFATTGLHGALVAVAIVGALALWALARQERD